MSKYVCPHCGSAEGAHDANDERAEYLFKDGKLEECRGAVVCDGCGAEIDDEENVPITSKEYEARHEEPDEEDNEEKDKSEDVPTADSESEWQAISEPHNLICESISGKPRGTDCNNYKNWCGVHAKWRRIGIDECKRPCYVCDAHHDELIGKASVSLRAESETNNALEAKNVERIRWFKENGESVEEKPHIVSRIEVQEKVGRGFISMSTKTSTNVKGYLFYVRDVEGERNALATQYAKLFCTTKLADDFEIKGNALLVEKREDGK